MKGWLRMKKVLYILIPIAISIVMFFVSANFFFKVPNPTGIGFDPITYKVAWMVAFGSLIISSGVSSLLFVRSKKGK